MDSIVMAALDAAIQHRVAALLAFSPDGRIKCGHPGQDFSRGALGS
jgi:hypothetical protein